MKDFAYDSQYLKLSSIIDGQPMECLQKGNNIFVVNKSLTQFIFIYLLHLFLHLLHSKPPSLVNKAHGGMQQ